MPLDDVTANAIYSSNLENLRRGGGVVGGGLGAIGGGLVAHRLGGSFAPGSSPLGRGLVAGAGILGGGIAGALAGKNLGERLAEPMTNSQLKRLEATLAQQPPQDDLYGVMPQEYPQGYPPEYFKQAENFPVPAIDVSTYSPNQGSVYPMAGITSLRPNPQTKATFFDTDATGARRNLNIGQEQSPMKTPELPELPKKEGDDKNDKNWIQRHPALTAGLGGAGLLVGGGVALHHFRPNFFSGLAQKGLEKGLDNMTDTVNKLVEYAKANPDSAWLKMFERLYTDGSIIKTSSYSRGYSSVFTKLAISVEIAHGPRKFMQPLGAGKYPGGVWNFLASKTAADDKASVPSYADVEAFKKKLKPGDIVLGKHEKPGIDPYTLLVKAFTGYPWGHAMIYMGDGKIKHLSRTRRSSGKMDLESEATIRDHQVDTMTRGDYDLLALRPKLPVKERTEAVERLKDLGHPTFSYSDFLQLGYFPWGKTDVNQLAKENKRKELKEKVRSMTCSGAVALAYPTIDFRKNKSALFVRPSDFLTSDKTEAIAKFVAEKKAEAMKDLVLDKVQPSTRNITGTSGVVGFPGKQPAPAMATPEKPEVRGDTGASIWR